MRGEYERGQARLPDRELTVLDLSLLGLDATEVSNSGRFGLRRLDAASMH
jgi:hypothetical protein